MKCGKIWYMNWVKSMRKLRIANGQGMVEFALVLPILLLVMLGIIEFGRLLFTYSMISAASREGARYAAAAGRVPSTGTQRHSDCAGIIAAATRIGAFAGVGAGDVTISYDEGPGTAAYSSVCPPSQYVNLKDRVIVTVSTSFQPVVPIMNVPTIPFSMTTRRTIIKDVQMITPTP